jgi:type I restriction enzyme M protein
LRTLGYDGAGDDIRGFDFQALKSEVVGQISDRSGPAQLQSENWLYFDVSLADVVNDKTARLDLKYWRPAVRLKCDALRAAKVDSIALLNTIKTSRGKSPPADAYVDAADGFSVVIKAGSNISPLGNVDVSSADYVEKSIYDELPASCHVLKGDVLLSSTGDGTLGKCAVYEGDLCAIADGHITIIRTDPKLIDPHYLCDYLRVGFGAEQIARLYTGSTGLIELSPDRAAEILVEVPGNVAQQKALSDTLRSSENATIVSVSAANSLLASARQTFFTKSSP